MCDSLEAGEGWRLVAESVGGLTTCTGGGRCHRMAGALEGRGGEGGWVLTCGQPLARLF